MAFVRPWLRKTTFLILAAILVFILAHTRLRVWLTPKLRKSMIGTLHMGAPITNDNSQITNVKPSQKKSILLFVGIFSAPVRKDRRTAVRETWMPKCQSNPKVVCWFITDGQDTRGKTLQGKVRETLENESRQHGDLVLADSPGSVNFGRRYLWMAKWASERYEFKYIFRVDDDYFVCFDKLLNELEFHRPRHKFTWGWLHCSMKGAVAIDEGFIIITNDVVQNILSKVNTTLLCHPFGGQNIGIWLNDMPNVTTFGDNKRLFHLNYDSKEKAAKRKEVCHSALGIHKSYPEEMRLYWKVFLNEDKNVTYEIPPIAFPCRHPRGINYKVFGGQYFAEPKLCKNNPIWDKGEFFPGRQGK